MGAGRKPKNPVTFVAIDGGAKLTPESERLLEPPDGLPPDQVPYWREYAPLAVRQRTLTEQTVPSFKLLCELEAEKRATKETIDRDGRTYIKCVVDGAGNEHQELKAHPLKRDYASLAKDVDRLMARFKLAPFGKPEMGTAPRTTVEQSKAVNRAKFFGTGGA